MEMSGHVLVLTALVLVAAGCGAGGSQRKDAGDVPGAWDARVYRKTGETTAAGPCNRNNTWGNFEVHVEPGGCGASGLYVDGPQPVWPLKQQEEGPCAFYAFDQPSFCEPPCAQGSLCGLGSVCHNFPMALDAGAVTISGTNPALVMVPTGSFAYYTTEDLPGLFVPGDELELTTAGGAGVGPFQLTARGVSLFSLDNLDFTMVEGEPFVVTWEPAGDPPETVMRLRLEIDHHARLAAYLECEAPNADGQMVVPAAMVQAAIEAGHAGAGIYVENAYLERFTSDETETDVGCARFVVRSRQKIYVETVLR